MAPRSGRVTPVVQTRGAARSFVESLDTYFKPAQDTRRQQALQNGLSQFGSIFETRAGEVQKERREGFYQQGQIDALAEQAGEELKGVREGNIFRQNSRFYEIGLNEGRGSAAAIKWKNDLVIEFEQSGIDAQKDPQAFRTWMDGKVNGLLSQFEGNQYAIDGAMPHVRETVQNLSSTYSSRLNDQLHQERIDIFETEVFDTLDGVFSGNFDEETTVAKLMDMREELFATEGPEANNAMVNAVLRYGSVNADATGILLMLRNRGADGLNLTPAQIERLADGLDAVEAEVSRRSKDTDEAEKLRRQKVSEDASNALIEATRDNPYLDLRTFYEEYTKTNLNGERAEWLFRDLEEMQGIIKQSRDQSGPPSGEVQLNFRIEMSQAETRQEKMEILKRYSPMLSPSEVEQEFKLLSGDGAYNTFINSPLNKRREKSFVDGLKVLQSGEEFMMDGSESTISILGGRYYAEAVEYLKATNPGMSDSELHREATLAVGEALYSEFRNSEVFMDNLRANPLMAEQLGLDKVLAQEAQIQQGEEIADETMLFLDDLRANGMLPPEEPQQTQEAPQGDQSSLETPKGPQVIQAAMELEPQTPEEMESDPDPLRIPEGTPYPEIADRFYAESLARLTDGRDDREFKVNAKNYQQVFDEDPEFAEEVVGLAFDLGTDPEALMAVMEFESGFSTSIRNAAGSGATGLIQFMPSTAKSLGTTTDALAQMTRKEQMVYVRKYFMQFGDRLRNGDIDDVYMTVLYPAAVGKPDSYVLFRSGTTAYRQNAGLDTNKDGTITKFEAAAKVRKRFYGAK